MQISKEIVIALIALSGVLLSVVVSLLASRFTIRTELRKLRFQVEQAYLTKVLEKRLATYPQLFYFLSHFNKEIQSNIASPTTLRSLLTNINEWDSQNSIFFSGRTTTICYDFRKMLAKLSEEKDESLQRRLSEDAFKRNLYYKIGTLELALKSDIGIYGVDILEDKDSMKVVNTLTEQAQKYGTTLIKAKDS